jgi:hypothetical protein
MSAKPLDAAGALLSELEESLLEEPQAAMTVARARARSTISSE